MPFKFSQDFLAAIPKTDLHVHLDGSLRIPTLIELARERGVELPSYTEEGLREQVFRDHYANLGEYLHGFKYTCAVLRDAESLERTAYELAQDAFAEGVRYMEVRYAPQLHVSDRLDFETTLVAVCKGFERAEKEANAAPAIVAGHEPPFRTGVIVCAMRFFTGGFSPYYRGYVEAHQYRNQREIIALASEDLARGAVAVRDRLGLPIVGFDLAGQESGYPAAPHKAAYDYAHRHFLSKTVHAGEAFGPESIFQAISHLHADRIGHGYHLFSEDRVTDEDITDPVAYCNALVQYVADRRVTIEVCLTSNLQTMPELKDIRDHAFARMLLNRLSVALCTDNRLVSNTTVTKEVQLAVDNFDISPERLKHMMIYGFKRSFFPGSYLEKRHYVRQIIDFYEARERQFGVRE